MVRRRTESVESRGLKHIRAAGFDAVGAGLRGVPSIAILCPEDRLEEGRALLRDPSEITSWRLPEVWRRLFADAGIVVPGQRARVMVLCGPPAAH